MYYEFQIPKFDTMEATLLVSLLNGQIVDNQWAKDILGTANPATIMSHLRAKGWNVYIKREVFRSKSSNGYDVNCTKYWIERDVILELMQNPRVQAFRDSYNKKCNI